MVSAVEIRPIDNHDGNKNEESCIRKCTPTWSRIGLLVLAVIIIVAAVGVSVALFASSDDTGNQNSSAAKDDFVSDLPSDTDDGNLLTAPTASPTLNGSVNTLKPTMDSSSSSTVARGGMIVPLYTWPIMDDSGQNCIDENYQGIATSTIAEQTIVIINPDDGPNYGNDFWTKQSFDVCISYLRSHGVKVIGYVPTKNAITLNATEDCSTTNGSCSDLYRDASSIKSDIDTWFSEYDGIQGIFLDNVDDMWTWEEQGWDSLDAVLSYNHDLVDHALAKSEKSYVVLNPSGAFPEGLMEPYYGNTRVIAVVFESPQSEYQPSRCTDLLYTSERGSFNRGPRCRYVPDWDEVEGLITKIANGLILPDQCAAIVYEATGNITEAVTLSATANIGWFYITDGTSGWSGSPSQEILDEQATAIALATSSVSKRASGLLIPLFSWPDFEALGENCVSEDYIRLATSKVASQTIVVVDPNEGPDLGDDQLSKKAFNICIDYLRQNGVEVLGFVQTREGNETITRYRGMEDVIGDVELWKTEYNVDGIFIDGVSDRWHNEDTWDSLDKLTKFNRGLVDYVLSKYNRVVMNPGYANNEEIMEPYYGDSRVITVVYYDDQQHYQRENCIDGLWNVEHGSFDQGPWCDFVPILDGIEPLKEKMDSGVITNEQSSAIIYQATEGNISQAVALGVAAGIGWFYLTDTEEDGLPSERVFEEQVTAIVAFS